MATIELEAESIDKIVRDEMMWHLERAYEWPQLEDNEREAMLVVLKYYSLPSEYEEAIGRLAWKQAMGNQV